MYGSICGGVCTTYCVCILCVCTYYCCMYPCTERERVVLVYVAYSRVHSVYTVLCTTIILLYMYCSSTEYTVYTRYTVYSSILL